MMTPYSKEVKSVPWSRELNVHFHHVTSNFDSNVTSSISDDVNLEVLTEYPPSDFMDAFKNPCWISRRTHRLDCLPYFYLAGMPKCGTTDIWMKLIQHPQIWKCSKEPHWWGKIRIDRFGGKTSLTSSVTSYYERWGNMMQKVVTKRGEDYASDVIFGDGSASTFWYNRYWRKFHPNATKCPTFAIPSLIHSMQPEAKIIVAFRNPIDRLFSDYLYFSKGMVSSKGFHEAVSSGIEEFRRCISDSGDLRTCVYKPDPNLETSSVRLRLGLYSVYLEDWLEHFKPNQLMIVKTEEWSENCPEMLTKLHRFLDLDDVTAYAKAVICNRERLNVGKKKNMAVLLPETVQLLREFYSPFNERLVAIFGDDNFTW